MNHLVSKCVNRDGVSSRQIFWGKAPVRKTKKFFKKTKKIVVDRFFVELGIEKDRKSVTFDTPAWLRKRDGYPKEPSSSTYLYREKYGWPSGDSPDSDVRKQDGFF